VADAEAELAKFPEKEWNAHHAFAKALSLQRAGQLEDARSWAAQAIELGRGAPARLLLGVLLATLEDRSGAIQAFERALEEAPTYAEAAYNLAVLHHQAGQYHPARERYLLALRLQPDYGDARYNLGLLTASSGATMESRHHLKKLEDITSAHDERVKSLRAVVEQQRSGAEPVLTLGQPSPREPAQPE
jgi:tetratricopeptide (TPR) repeat protein